MDKRKILAKRLKARMMTLDMNSSELAEKAGVSTSTVSRAVTATSIPGRKNMKKIAEALGTDETELLKNSEDLSKSVEEVLHILDENISNFSDKEKMFLARFILEPEEERRRTK